MRLGALLGDLHSLTTDTLTDAVSLLSCLILMLTKTMRQLYELQALVLSSARFSSSGLGSGCVELNENGRPTTYSCPPPLQNYNAARPMRLQYPGIVPLNDCARMRRLACHADFLGSRLRSQL